MSSNVTTTELIYITLSEPADINNPPPFLETLQSLTQQPNVAQVLWGPAIENPKDFIVVIS